MNPPLELLLDDELLEELLELLLDEDELELLLDDELDDELDELELLPVVQFAPV